MNIMVWGYYGHYNLGDDYILYSILTTLENCGRNKITVISYKDRYLDLFKRFKNLSCRVITWPWRKVLTTVETMFNDVWIIGGGGLWPNESPDNIGRLLPKIRLAKRFGCKICIYGVDVNSMNQERTKEDWKKIADLADLFIVRNRKTKALFDSIQRSKVIRSSDITFALTTKEEKEHSRNVLYKLNIYENEYIVWAIPMEFNEGEKTEQYYRLVKALQKLANESAFKSYTHVLLPFNYNKDMVILNDIAKGIDGNVIICDSSYNLDIGEKRLLFKYAKTSVCMRFHSIMFSIYHCTPGLFISYSDKASDVVRENGLDEYLVEYGIRDNSDFYRKFDLDEEKVLSIANRLIDGDLADSRLVEKASENLKSRACNGEKIFSEWIKHLS